MGIEIDNSRIAWVQNSVKNPKKLIRLTTISDNQKKAELRLYIKTQAGKALLCAETITGIPPMPAGGPSIDIKTAVRKKKLLYKIYLNGSLVKEGSVSLKKYSKTGKPLFLLLLIPAAAVIFFLQTRGENGRQEKPAVIRSAQGPVSADAPATKAPSQTAAPDEPVVSPEPEAGQNQARVQEPETVPEDSETVSTIELSESITIYFPPDSALLTSEAKNELRNFISLLPDPGSLLESNLELAVEGHCARYGTEEGRAELSRERASNTYNYLLSIWNGEASAEVRGAGASKPVTVDREKQYLNRRVYLELKGTIIKDFTEN